MEKIAEIGKMGVLHEQATTGTCKNTRFQLIVEEALSRGFCCFRSILC